MLNDVIKSNVYDFDMNVYMSKGFITNGELNDIYCTLYKNYKILLDKYLLMKLSLKNYDDKLSTSELEFKSIDFKQMDCYQQLSTMGLKYLYLRNDLYLEKLSMEDISYVLNLSSEQLMSFDDNLIKFIERTYMDVIDSRKDKTIKQLNCYGPDRDIFWIDSTELVFGVRYDEMFEDDTRSDEEWEDIYFKRSEYLGNMLLEMSQNCSSIIDNKVNFIFYDEFAVKKNKTR